MVNASYKGRLNSGDYQFSFLGNIINKEKSIGFLMPHPGYINKIILETPLDFNKIPNFDRNVEYVAFKSPLFEVVIKKKVPKKEEFHVKILTCEIHYDKIPGNVRKVDPLNDELKRAIVYDYGYYPRSINAYLETGDVLNIKTKITNPKNYEFLKDDDIYHFGFLIKLNPFF